MTTVIYEDEWGRLITEKANKLGGWSLEIWANPWDLNREDAGKIGKALLEWSFGSRDLPSTDRSPRRVEELLQKIKELNGVVDAIPTTLEGRKVAALEKIAESLCGASGNDVYTQLRRIGEILSNMEEKV